MWILRIIWTVCRAYYIDGFGATIKDYEIYKRSDVYYG